MPPAVPLNTLQPNLWNRIGDFVQSKSFMPTMRTAADFGAALAPRNLYAQSMAGFAGNMANRSAYADSEAQQSQLRDLVTQSLRQQLGSATNYAPSGSSMSPTPGAAGGGGTLSKTTVQQPQTPAVPMTAFGTAPQTPAAAPRVTPATGYLSNAAQALMPHNAGAAMINFASNMLGDVLRSRPAGQNFGNGTGAAAALAPLSQPRPETATIAPVAPTPPVQPQAPPVAAQPAPAGQAGFDMNPLAMMLAMRPVYSAGMDPGLHLDMLKANDPWANGALDAQDLVFRQAEALRKATEPRVYQGEDGGFYSYDPTRGAVDVLRAPQPGPKYVTDAMGNVIAIDDGQAQMIYESPQKPVLPEYDFMNVPGVGLMRVSKGDPNPQLIPGTQPPPKLAKPSDNMSATDQGLVEQWVSNAFADEAKKSYEENLMRAGIPKDQIGKSSAIMMANILKMPDPTERAAEIQRLISPQAYARLNQLRTNVYQRAATEPNIAKIWQEEVASMRGQQATAPNKEAVTAEIKSRFAKAGQVLTDTQASEMADEYLKSR